MNAICRIHFRMSDVEMLDEKLRPAVHLIFVEH